MAVQTQQQALLLVLGSILAIDLGLILLWAVRRYGGRTPRPTFAPRWSLIDVWAGGQLALLLTGIACVPLAIVLTLLPGKPIDLTNMDSPEALIYFLLPATILQNAACFVVPAAFVNFKYRLPLRAIGLPPRPRTRDTVAGILLGIVLLVVAQGIGLGLTALAEHYKNVAWVAQMLAYEKSNPVAEITKILPKVGIPGLILGTLAIGVAAPIGEEVLFRGFALNALSVRFGPRAGLILSALIFALPHTYSPLGQSVVFLMGLTLGWAYRCSGSLWTTIFLHATNNMLLVFVAYFLPHLAV